MSFISSFSALLSSSPHAHDRSPAGPVRHSFGVWLNTVAMVGLFAVAGCVNTGGTSTQEGCAIDGDCPVAFRCEANTGVCLCAEDSACDGSEFCNSF